VSGRIALLASVTLAIACSSTPAAQDGGGGGDAAADAAPTEFTQKGRIIDYTLKQPAADAIISVGATTTKSDAMGLYSIKIPANKPFFFTLTGDMKIKLIEQERIASGDVDQSDTNLISVVTQNLLKALITDYDPKLATLNVNVNKRSSCASVTGATIALDPPQANMKLRYFQGGLPSMNPSAMDGEFPTAILYNIDPKAPVKVTVTHPTCKQVAYPLQDPDRPPIKYTGNVTLEAGDVTSYARAWVE
jgi:hypothetical protein